MCISHEEYTLAVLVSLFVKERYAVVGTGTLLQGGNISLPGTITLPGTSSVPGTPSMYMV